jgi:SPP1 family predicted phage head-tail adaptor
MINDPGRLNTKVVIESKTITRGTDGSETESWATVITTWAKKVTKGSKEFYAAQKNNAETTALFIIRHRSTAVTRDMRLKEGSRIYEIIGTPDNDGNKNQWLLISCKEVEN